MSLPYFTRPDLRRWLITGMVIVIALIVQPMVARAETDESDINETIWSDTDQEVMAASRTPQITPKEFRSVRLNTVALQQLLQTVPSEQVIDAQSNSVIFALPLPDNSFGRFRVTEYSMMEPELAAKFSTFAYKI